MKVKFSLRYTQPAIQPASSLVRAEARALTLVWEFALVLITLLKASGETQSNKAGGLKRSKDGLVDSNKAEWTDPKAALVDHSRNSHDSLWKSSGGSRDD